MRISATERKAILNDTHWDIIIIGGGATGLGAALDAASRGYRTLLVEQSDFAKGTSSRSTKLVHGGVRYLAQGDIGLVYQALRERGLLQVNAAHLVEKEEFIIPCYDRFSVIKYLTGLKMYDWLAGKYSFGRSKYLSKKEVLNKMPGLSARGLVGGIRYYDGKFDDARLAVNIAATCVEQGGTVMNYVKVQGLLKDTAGKINGVKVQDQLSGETYTTYSRAVINATGIFVDDILQMNVPNAKKLVRPSQGVHVVVNRSFLDSEAALMIPKTSDNRVLFAVPWHGKLLVGTTDTPIDEHSLEPRALESEVDFILNTASQYLEYPVSRKDVLSVFAGLRPLAAPDKEGSNSTKEISRDHKLIVAASGLITITGGKWTTYRKMAEETINKTIETVGLAQKDCVTRQLKIHGCTPVAWKDHLHVYGTDREGILDLASSEPGLAEKLHPMFPNIRAEVVWAVRNEMAQTVEDVLARRLRILFVDAAAAEEMSRQVAGIIAHEQGRTEEWIRQQVEEFGQLAAGYLLNQKAMNSFNSEKAVFSS